jgi:hypothetical protein
MKKDQIEDQSWILKDIQDSYFEKRFPRFSADVALELELFLHGKSRNPEYIPRLAKMLHDFSSSEHYTYLQQHCLPLYNALKLISQKPRFVDELKARGMVISDLALDLRLAAIDMEAFRELPRERIEDLRDFCLALYKSFAAREARLRSWEPRHPYRRDLVTV